MILPASAFLEKSGTFTNAERRFQLVQAGDRPAGRREDRPRDHHDRLARALGHEMGLRTPAEVMDEIAALTPELRGRQPRADRAPGLQWPVAADGTDSPILYDEQFSTCPAAWVISRRSPTSSRGRSAERGVPADPRHRPAPAALQRRHDDPPDREPRAGRPRLARDQPRRCRSGCGSPTVSSSRSAARVGRIETEAKVTDRSSPGHVFTAFHFPEVRTNLLIGTSADVNTSCPEYKVVAVDVRPIAEAAGIHAGARRARDAVA